MNSPKPIRCQKCGKPLGYVTVLAKGITSLLQPLQDIKSVAIARAVFDTVLGSFHSSEDAVQTGLLGPEVLPPQT